MIKEWATVVAWQNGQATLQCDVKASCTQCASRKGCGTRLLNKLGPENTHHIVVEHAQPLVEGQKVELGIGEGSLLGSALLVYMVPLAGLFAVASLFQSFFNNDMLTCAGAVIGGAAGFGIARLCSFRLSLRPSMHPVILSVGLPPDLYRAIDAHPPLSQ